MALAYMYMCKLGKKFSVGQKQLHLRAIIEDREKAHTYSKERWM